MAGNSQNFIDHMAQKLKLDVSSLQFIKNSLDRTFTSEYLSSGEVDKLIQLVADESFFAIANAVSGETEFETTIETVRVVLTLSVTEGETMRWLFRLTPEELVEFEKEVEKYEEWADILLKGKAPQSSYMYDLEDYTFSEYGDTSIWFQLSRVVPTPVGEEDVEPVDYDEEIYESQVQKMAFVDPKQLREIIVSPYDTLYVGLGCALLPITEKLTQ